MRRIVSLFLVLGGVVSMTGCGDKNAETKAAEEKLRGADKARAEAAKAVRAEYVREADERLKAFDDKAKKLEADIAAATGQAKADLEKKYAATKGKRDAAAERLRELKEASAERWDKVKDATGSAFDELKKAFD